jgi:hypothetical protein
MKEKKKLPTDTPLHLQKGMQPDASTALYFSLHPLPLDHL